MTPLREVVSVFLRLGFTAFGGPAAHVAMMEDEIVRRRGWVTAERFLDLFSVASLLPGPSSSELAVYLGAERAGWRGYFAAAACFVLPASLMVGLLAAAYVRWGALPAAAGVLWAIKPAVVAVVLDALLRLAPRAAKTRWLALVGTLAAAASLALHADASVVLAGAGALNAIRARARAGAPPSNRLHAVGALPLFLAFAKIGATVFGSGYVILAILRADLVEARHWLTEEQLVDAVAIGQVTPGPVFTVATFIGYVAGGVPGAIAATVGIFLPGFVLVGITRRHVGALRRSPAASAFLDGVNVAALGLMGVVLSQLGRGIAASPGAIVLGVAAAVLLYFFRVSSTWVVLGAAAIGVARSLF